MAPAIWRMGQQSQEELGQEELELEEINLELRSSPPPPREQAADPSAGPLQYHPRTPPAVVKGLRVTYIKTARWIKPKDNSAAALCVAPLGTPDAIRPGSATSASTGEKPLPELGPYGGLSPRSVATRS